MAKKKENTDNKEVLGENKENSAAKTADAGAENGVPPLKISQTSQPGLRGVL